MAVCLSRVFSHCAQPHLLWESTTVIQAASLWLTVGMKPAGNDYMHVSPFLALKAVAFRPCVHEWAP
jgi:hypothetical protein